MTTRRTTKSTKLGRVSPSYPTASATLLIGQAKGKQAPNRRGYCATAPSKFSKMDVDETVRNLRVGAVAGRASSEAEERKARKAAEAHFAASRTSQRGWYKGVPEDSVAFTFHHDPEIPGEETPEAFRFRMKQLAEKVTSVLCQDSVILTFDTPGEKGTRFVDTNDPEDAQKRREAQDEIGRRRR